MKSKFYLKSSGKEVELGDFVYDPVLISTDFGLAAVRGTLTPKLLEILLKQGVIIKKEISDSDEKVKEDSKKEIPMYLNYYIKILAAKQECSVDTIYKFLNLVNSFNKASALNIILREIAVVIDQKYSDHINKSPKIYCISNLSGRIIEVNKAYIKNYRNFAAFRTIEDAKIACKICSSALRDIFKDERKGKKSSK